MEYAIVGQSSSDDIMKLGCAELPRDESRISGPGRGEKRPKIACTLRCQPARLKPTFQINFRISTNVIWLHDRAGRVDLPTPTVYRELHLAARVDTYPRRTLDNGNTSTRTSMCHYRHPNMTTIHR